MKNKITFLMTMIIIIISGTALAQEPQYTEVNLKKLIKERKKLKHMEFDSLCPAFFRTTLVYNSLQDLKGYAKNKNMQCLGKLPLSQRDSAVIYYNAAWSYSIHESATFKYDGPLPLPDYKIDFVETYDYGVARHVYIYMYDKQPSAADTVFMQKKIFVIVSSEIYECHNEEEKLQFKNDTYTGGLLAVTGNEFLYQGVSRSYLIGKNSD